MSSSQATIAELKQQAFARHRSNTSSKKKSKHGIKGTTVAAYSGVFLLIMSMVAIGYQPPQQIDSVASVIDTPTQKVDTEQPSVDQLVATNVAAGIAERADLPIAANVANLSISLSVASALSQSGGSISKPQIIQSSDTRGVQHYTAVAGDTADKIAAQFGVSATTIKWANDLSSDAVEAGRQLTIPPVDGVMYTTVAGDTIDSVAAKYGADKEQIIAFNDLELTGLTVGTRIIVPGGDLPETERPGYVAPTPVQTNGYGSGSGFRMNTQFANASAGNRYAFGNCTWYAYERRAQLGRPIGSFWGNAKSWIYSAQAAGFPVGGAPKPGSLFIDQAGYYGHVGVVESVHPDGSLTVTEMNNYAYGGFNIVNSRTILPNQVGQYTYID